jgi:hypothetical protein
MRIPKALSDDKYPVKRLSHQRSHSMRFTTHQFSKQIQASQLYSSTKTARAFTTPSDQGLASPATIHLTRPSATFKLAPKSTSALDRSRAFNQDQKIVLAGFWIASLVGFGTICAARAVLNGGEDGGTGQSLGLMEPAITTERRV